MLENMKKNEVKELIESARAIKNGRGLHPYSQMTDSEILVELLNNRVSYVTNKYDIDGVPVIECLLPALSMVCLNRREGSVSHCMTKIGRVPNQIGDGEQVLFTLLSVPPGDVREALTDTIKSAMAKNLGARPAAYLVRRFGDPHDEIAVMVDDGGGEHWEAALDGIVAFSASMLIRRWNDGITAPSGTQQ